ncbi:alginate lyase family protein [Mesorhizobium sp.]|uniref:heparinase II/III family protein n=1 Tax=Mesorhizobium sp. TaxID=1871066 RepID=UPI00257DF8A9|nr:alginate lyase family protein [Mesorhizobium sp.]
MPALRSQSQIGPEVFRFLDVERSLNREGWDDTRVDKLWRYNLHYFDDLNASEAAERLEWHRELMERWITENPAGAGTGWEPYPTSLRIVNWIKWVLSGRTLSAAALQSLAVQARWLNRRLEYHLLGNHLFANAKALVFAGLFFEGAEAAGWLERGCAILGREVPEQILDDGGHFERSTMYHALALEDMLDLLNLSRGFPGTGTARWQAFVAALPERIEPMRRWLASMCHPDGEIALFNDAALGIAPPPWEIDAYALRLGLSNLCDHATRDAKTCLVESGYIRLEAGAAVALLDVAAVGPDYLPGHAHADTLSFELSLYGRRVLVNSGTSVYGTSDERMRQRGTSAHNTVVVAGENSSEVWSGFRVARRARPFNLTFDNSNGLKVSCAHDGYRRLSESPTHRRSWELRRNEFLVSDSVTGGNHRSEANFHFHPDVALEEDETCSTGQALFPDGNKLHWTVEVGEGRLEPSTWHPEFGSSQPTTRLVISLLKGKSTVRFSWDNENTVPARSDR